MSPLQNAEQNAVNNNGQSGFYSGSGKPNLGKALGKGNLLGALKLSGKKGKYGALGLTLAIMIGTGAWMGSSNSLLVGALSAQLSTVTQTDAASTSITRVNTIANMIRKGESTAFLRNRFGKNEIIANADGTFSWKGQVVTDFNTLYDTDVEFRSKFDKSTFSKIANSYDEVGNEVITTFSRTGGKTRNNLEDHQDTGNTEVDARNLDENFTNQYKDKYDTEMGNKTAVNETEKELDGDGKETGNVKGDIKNDPNGRTQSDAIQSDSAAAKAKAESTISKLSDGASRIVNSACTLIELGAIVAAIIAGMHTLQAIQTHWTYLEPVDKTKDGDGDKSGINTLLNKYNESYTTTRTDPSKIEVSASGFDINADVAGSRMTQAASTGSISTNFANAEVTESGTALEEPNLSALLSESSYDKAAGAGYSLEASLATLGAALGVYGVAHKACVKLAAGIAGVKLLSGIVMALSPGGPAILGAAAVWDLTKTFFVGLGINALVTFSFSTALSFMIPELQKAMTNPVDSALGKPLGAYIFRASGAANSAMARAGSGATAGNTEAILAYNKVNNVYLAQQAEVDRFTHSPFDISNKNTFLGSIAFSLLPLGLNSSSSSIGTIMRTTSTSIASLTGTALADGENTSYMTTFGDCPALEAAGGRGDIVCNPIGIHDVTMLTSTFDNNSEYKRVIEANMENGQIKPDSNLASFISNCSDRTSPPGFNDATISQREQKGNAFLAAVPYVSEIYDIANAVIDDEVMAWADYSLCVDNTNNPDKPDFVRKFWNEEGKYYQHYIQQERIKEQIGVYEGSRSPVGLYREEYRRANPVDNSTAGIIAQYSGVTKETAQGVLDLLAYYEFIQDYDASTRFAMLEEVFKNSNDIAADFSNKIPLEDNAEEKEFLTNQQYIIYADVRNRSYAI